MPFFLCKKCKREGKVECDCNNHPPFPNPYSEENVAELRPSLPIQLAAEAEDVEGEV